MMNTIKVLLLLLMMNLKVGAQVIINEFMAENATSGADMIDYDDYSDWIELYNNQNVTVDLSGYYITDNLKNPLKWEIQPGTTIEPYGFLVLRADGFNAAPGKVSYREYWPWEAFTVKRYHTNFKLDALGEELGLFKAAKSEIKSIVSPGSDWKFLDNGSDQGTAWKEVSFNDDTWKSGAAQLGYGDGDEATILGYGNNTNAKYITTYFRKSVQISNAAQISSLHLRLLRDDGAVVYLNGQEILRSNLPVGIINYRTLADAAVSGTDENAFYLFDIPKTYLLEGKNVFTVEIHQSSANSSDISFDMEINASVLADSVTAELIDSISYGRQIQDVSMGRDPGNNFKWAYYGQPTPGTANSNFSTLSKQYAGNVTFSLSGGFYTSPQILSLTSNSTDEQIYYSTDGSLPTTNSLKYFSPITISENTVVRARVYTKDKLPGEISSNSYFINEVKSILPVASIITDPLTMWDNEVGIYKNNIKGREIPVNVEYFEPDEKPAFSVKAGARIGGFNIWRFAQKPLNIYLKGHYGNDNISYQLFDSKPVTTFTSIEFRNGGDNWNTSFIVDDMAESILKGQMQNGSAAYKPCIVYLNGKYWGIHDLRERADLQYFASNYHVDPSGIDYMGYVQMPSTSYIIGLEVFEGNAEGYNSFLSFVEGHDLTVKENYDYVNTQMDVNSLIDYVAAEVYVCNTSWRHNREWWRAKNGDGKWRWLIQDLDRGFNIQNVSSNILSSYVSEYSLFSKLLKNTEFKNKFIQQFAAHLNSTFTSERISKIIDTLALDIAPEMPRHIERWKSEQGISSMLSWNNELTNMKNFSAQRVANVFTQIKNQFSLPGISELNIDLNNPNSGRILINGIPLCGSLSKMKFFRNIPMQVTAVPNVGYRFSRWDKISGTDSISITIQSDTTITAIFEPSADIILPEKIEKNTTLNMTDKLYTASGDIVVSTGVTLTIEKGVNIRMPLSSGIYVKGNLVINGTEDQRVSILPNKAAGAEKWGALCFDNSSGKNTISYVTIRNAGTGIDAINQKAAISCINSEVVLDHINIEDVNFPIFALGGNTTLRSSSIKANGICDYIGIRHGKGLVEYNSFYGNKSPDTDAIDFDGDTSIIARGNRIYNFRGANCDAIDIGEESHNILIRGNFIYNSTDKGISVGQLSDVIAENNVIVGCDMGVAVKDKSHLTANNNTFYANNIAVACYEKNYERGGGYADVKNSILSASKTASFLADNLSSINISYCLSDMEMLPGIGNIFGDPLFINGQDYNLQLKNGSPCFDSGDPAFIRDPDNSLSDIGAYYKYAENDLPVELRETLNTSVVINEIMYNDASTPDTKDWIELCNPADKQIDISGWLLTDSDSTHKFSIPAGIKLNPGEFIVICKDTEKFFKVYPQITNNIGNLQYGFAGNDKVMLYDNSGKLVNFVSYHNSSPWPSAPDGNKKSLELRNPGGLNYLTTNWKESVGTGTPGKQNSVYEVTPVEVVNELPGSFMLAQNYPNPFNPVTTISYSLPHKSFVKLKIFNILGREIITIVNKEQIAGEYKIQFNGSSLPSGVYIYTIQAGQFRESKKLILLK